jgi:hypothetical protein
MELAGHLHATARHGRVVVLAPEELESAGSGCIDVYAALRPYAWARTVFLRAGASAVEDDPDEVLVGEVVLDGASG